MRSQNYDLNRILRCRTHFVRLLYVFRTLSVRMSYGISRMTHVQVPYMTTYDNYAYERVQNAYDKTYDKIMRTKKSRNVRQYSYACRTRTQESRTTNVRTGPKNVVRYLYVSCTQFLRKMSVYWAHKNHTKCHQHKNLRTLSVT